MADTPIDRLARATPSSLSRRARGLSDRAIAWVFVTPTILLLLAINIFPLIWTVHLSFTNFAANKPNAEVKCVGLRNYQRILTDEAATLVGSYGSRLCILEGFVGHAEQCNIRVRRFGGRNVPYGEAAE